MVLAGLFEETKQHNSRKQQQMEIALILETIFCAHQTNCFHNRLNWYRQCFKFYLSICFCLSLHKIFSGARNLRIKWYELMMQIAFAKFPQQLAVYRVLLIKRVKLLILLCLHYGRLCNYASRSACVQKSFFGITKATFPPLSHSADEMNINFHLIKFLPPFQP